MNFGQLVIGPPGSGKTTYCHAMQQMLEANGRRVCVVNLDPANDALPYRATIDVSDLITMEEVMDAMQLGPNGGLLYCVDYLEKNLAWLKKRIKEQPADSYFLFDLPGQVELYTHHASMKKIVTKLTQAWRMKLTCVHLVDSHHCSDSSKFLSVVLLSLCSMTQFELPHVNLLSKLDLMEQYGELEFGMDFYTDVMDLSYLLPRLNRQQGGVSASHPLSQKFHKLNAAIAELIESYNLVSFLPLDVRNREMMAAALQVIDKANGCIYVTNPNGSSSSSGSSGSSSNGTGASQSNAQDSWQQRLLNMVHKTQQDEMPIMDIQEKYIPRTTKDT